MRLVGTINIYSAEYSNYINLLLGFEVDSDGATASGGYYNPLTGDLIPLEGTYNSETNAVVLSNDVGDEVTGTYNLGSASFSGSAFDGGELVTDSVAGSGCSLL